jgi:hypothetical protein
VSVRNLINEHTNAISYKPSNSNSKTAVVPPKAGSEAQTSRRQYWLMKAEPESRLEKGHDIKFSIDDLAAKTEPEPWDGKLYS